MRVGILGAGQLGRMLAAAGQPLGHTFVLYDTSGTPCPGEGELICDPDNEALDEFISTVDRVTFEHEHVPLETLERIQQRVELVPNPEALALGKDRINEKNLFKQLGIPTPRYFSASSCQELQRGLAQLGTPAIAKTVTGGYDGKGQYLIDSVSSAPDAWSELQATQVVVEEFVEFEREISVIGARNAKGEMVLYPLAENRHKNGILRVSIAPAPAISDTQFQQARSYLEKLAHHLDYVGVIALELFATPTGLVANEIATRVHNSGHWTMNGATTSQFENHIRAITNQPLGDTDALGVSCMLNIIGDHKALNRLSSLPDVHCYDYGKSARPGRKLGHVNITADSYEKLNEKVRFCISKMDADEQANYVVRD